MRILTVEYRRLVSRDFNNETVGATASVDGNQTPEQALDELREWVGDHLATAELETASKPGGSRPQSRWQRFRDWLARHRRKPDDDLPF